MKILTISEIKNFNFNPREDFYIIQCGLFSGRIFSLINIPLSKVSGLSKPELDQFIQKNARRFPVLTSEGFSNLYIQPETDVDKQLLSIGKLSKNLFVSSKCLNDEYHSIEEEEFLNEILPTISLRRNALLSYVHKGMVIEKEKIFSKNKQAVIDLCIVHEFVGEIQVRLKYDSVLIDEYSLTKDQENYNFAVDLSKYEQLYSGAKLSIELFNNEIGPCILWFYLE